MIRGDLIKAVFPGEYGKPRPSLIVQSDRLAALDSILLCPLTSAMETDGPTRVRITPDNHNGLISTSLVMVDKVTAISRSRCREKIGSVSAPIMEQVNGLLFFVSGLLD